MNAPWSPARLRAGTGADNGLPSRANLFLRFIAAYNGRVSEPSLDNTLKGNETLLGYMSRSRQNWTRGSPFTDTAESISIIAGRTKQDLFPCRTLPGA